MFPRFSLQRERAGRESGFTITELLTSVALFATLASLTVPLVTTTLGNMRMSSSARLLQSELQNARLRAVSANRPMRVRFNCPADGQFRMVELIGTPASPDSRDDATDRCDPAVYPFPPRDMNLLTLPNHDGAVRRLGRSITFGSGAQTLEFWPDGTVHANTGNGNPWPAVGSSGVMISITDGTTSKHMSVNGVGKVQTY